MKSATNADLFAEPREPHGTFDEMPWYLQRFVRSICDMRQPWMLIAPTKDDDHGEETET